MIQSTLNQIGNAINTFTHNNLEICGVSIDSRTVKKGNLFIAIKGSKFDGHQYIKQAIKQGAVAIIASQAIDEVSVPVLVVNDTRIALGQIAKCWRQANHWLVVAITGSNGKTSAKEMARCVLQSNYVTEATKGNLNNDFGVPLTLLATAASTQALVVEMGANHQGEIAYLSDMVQPDIVLVNNIGDAHVAGFGSIEGTAKGKAEIYQGLKDKGVVILNSDDSFASYLKQQFSQSFIDFSIHHNATIQATNIQQQTFDIVYLSQTTPVNLALNGLHNVANATAAIAIGVAAGLDIQQAITGLKQYQGVAGRLQVKKGIHQATIIDDTYNANLSSMKAGIDYLVGLEGEHWLMVGTMAELGTETETMHKELALYAKQHGVSKLYVVGEMGKLMCQEFGENCRYDLDGEVLTQKISQSISKNVNLLIKGSRSAAMEQYVDQLGANLCC